MKVAGLKMPFGTDQVGDLYKKQTREFLLRSEVLQPLAILHSATSVTADALMLGDQVGNVAVRMVAYLIVVDGSFGEYRGISGECMEVGPDHGSRMAPKNELISAEQASPFVSGTFRPRGLLKR